MEVEKFASRGVAGAALGTGIAGLSLGVLNGGLGNLFNGVGGSTACPAYTRYDAEKDARIANLETEVKLRDANTYTLGEMSKLRDYVDGKFGCIEANLCEQKVYNATNTATIACLSGQVNSMNALLANITKTVVPNGAICPGWGDVTVTVTPTTTTT